MGRPRVDAHVRQQISDLLNSRAVPGEAHWRSCYADHIDCAAATLLREVDRLTDELRSAEILLADGKVDEARVELRRALDVDRPTDT